MENPVFSPADILLPKGNFEKWSVIACDQYTSRPDYWEECAEITKNFPSTLNLIYPEVYLSEKNRKSRIDSINAKMKEYLEKDIYNEYKNSYIYTERTQKDGKKRCGLIGKVDLESYDYNENSISKVRATEKTVLERIPPRVEIRKNAVTELPHIMLLCDDPKKTLIEKLTESKDKMTKLYDFELMQNGGHLCGYLVPSYLNDEITDKITKLGENKEITLAVGDGNHSLATAKACYTLNPNEKNRYALCEIVNLHSDALEFEPIFRTCENVDTDDILREFYKFLESEGAKLKDNGQKIIFIAKDKQIVMNIQNPPHVLAVGTVQLFLDFYVQSHPQTQIDYIHGETETEKIANKDNSCGFIYDSIKKSELFPSVEKSGVLPRKTFSMGHANDKRYYMEVRKII